MKKEILAGISILYVEDENDVREFTSKLLSSLVKKVYTAENGLVGLETFIANKDDIDLIVTDINMPKLDGLDMCIKIKEHNEHIPIVVTSAHNDPDFLKRAIDVGVSAYAMKPIDLYQLVDSIIKAVEPLVLKRELEELNISLETRVDQEIKKIKSILDAQDNIVMVINKEKITNVNKKFYEFFEVESLEEFFEENKIFYDCFQDQYGFITKEILIAQDSWINYIKDLQEIDRVVKIRNKFNVERIFAINVDNYENKLDYYVLSLTDITELKEKSNLLEYQASHDSLTGLYNRNKFKDLFGKELRRGIRYDNQLSLILFDIDDFKKVNDNCGHQVGDEVLVEISKRVLSGVREHDTVVRWGGEEFIILLPETNIDGAVMVAEKIRLLISEIPISSENLNITASFGISKMNEDDTKDSFILRADKALYKAKDNGKNQVVTI
ncbi:MAG: diguanylate cyclase [Poseidonibacter sp.]|uniref:GGDEF domain-containing response regulator n=1 Tax=Poseidonibacter sp. TaxID=2321188 RepID=UPI00359EA94C